MSALLSGMIRGAAYRTPMTSRHRMLRSITAVVMLLSCAWPASAQDDATCLECHADQTLFSDMAGGARLVVDVEALSQTAHGPVGLSCVDCHQDLAGSDDYPHATTLEKVDCGMCHEDVSSVYAQSLHGYALQRGNARAPTCTSCHGAHNILPSTNPLALTHKVRLPTTCARCHGEAGLLTDHIVKLPQSFTDYAQSVHGRGVGRGVAAAASCEDCHEVHNLKGAVDPASPINPLNVASTCGKCHPDIQLEYDSSIHGRAVQAGVTDSPTCTDCHGEHLILSPQDSDASTYASALATETCGSCHEDPIIIAKYNLTGGVVGSYVDSYHGWAARRQDERSATCVSCHSAHKILPKSDPGSTVSAHNVVSTCQHCHKNADDVFAASYTHEAASISINPVNRTIRTIYLVLIIFIISAMVVHNLVIINYFLVESRKNQSASPWVLRFSGQEVIQHLLVTVTFIVLVITGFALRFPDAWWVRRLLDIGLTEALRGDLHRIAAVLMIATSFYHLWYLLFTNRGKEQLRAMLPAGRDFVEFVQNIRYHTWSSTRKVKFGRFDYSQKAEYWALIWGTIIMIITGLVLWLPELAVKVFPSLIVSASQTIHYYEAWLATLAILVWHFFFVIFHPEQYPMSWTWLTGRMSLNSVKEHHRGWYEEEIAGTADPKVAHSEAPEPRHIMHRAEPTEPPLD